nr:HD domain-containing phosphohydrolase [Desulfatitalea alkaliphila]
MTRDHTLLLVDDEISITRALQRLFRKEGYRILTAQSGPEALEVLGRQEPPVSMIISDQRMPVMNGAQFLEQAKDLQPRAIRYLLTGYSDLEAVIQAVNRGEIHRYLSKPWNDEDLLLQVRQSLEHFELLSENQRLTELTIAQNQQLSRLNQELEGKVAERTRQVVEKSEALAAANRMLEESFMEVVRLLSSTVEVLNPDLGRYMRQVAPLSRRVGEALGLSGSELDTLEMAGMIHDIGLIHLPEALWRKEDEQLSEEERRQFIEHPRIGALILSRVEKLTAVGEIVLHHHEHADGNGFPNGLQADQIPLASRVLLAVSDYCHMLATWPRQEKKLAAMIRRRFDPAVVGEVALDQDPETLVHEMAERKLLLEAGKKYDVKVVNALIAQLGTVGRELPEMALPLDRLQADMVLIQDLRLKDGRLLLTRGARLTASSIRSIQTIGQRGMIDETVKVALNPHQG